MTLMRPFAKASLSHFQTGQSIITSSDIVVPGNQDVIGITNQAVRDANAVENALRG
jgi:hypothetical protein